MKVEKYGKIWLEPCPPIFLLSEVNDKIRKLSPRECARLQGFPDTYKLDENNNNAYTQLGNSVVVNVLQEIIEQFVIYLK